MTSIKRRTNPLVSFALPASLGLAVCIGGALIAAEAAAPKSASAKARVMTTSLPCASLTRILLHEAGISPEALAAIGASDEQVTTIVTAAKGMCDAQAGEFDAAQAAYEDARGRVDRLEAQVRSGKAVEGTTQDLTDARDDLEAAVAARLDIIDTVLSAVAGALTTEQENLLANVTAAGLMEVPVEYKTLARTDAQFVAIRDGLARRRELDPQATGTITEDSEAEVAALLVQNRLEDVREAWNDALGG